MLLTGPRTFTIAAQRYTPHALHVPCLLGRKRLGLAGGRAISMPEIMVIPNIFSWRGKAASYSLRERVLVFVAQLLMGFAIKDVQSIKLVWLELWCVGVLRYKLKFRRYLSDCYIGILQVFWTVL